MHTCDDISISEILYHYHDMENYITIINILIILHITKANPYLYTNITCINACEHPCVLWELIFCLINYIQSSENTPPTPHMQHTYQTCTPPIPLLQ